jgi:hypothetical protein
MEKLEAYRQAVAELGNVSAEELSKYIEEKHGVQIAPNFMPLYRASLQEWEKVNRQRQEAKVAITATANA